MQLHAVSSLPGPVYSIAFSPKGGYLATGGKDKLIRLWGEALKVEKHIFLNSSEFSSGHLLSSSGDTAGFFSWGRYDCVMEHR